jgi:hypothetical protein
MGWVVNATPRLLNPQERPGTHYIGNWMGLKSRSGQVIIFGNITKIGQ